MAGVQAAKIESNTPHTRRKHRRAKSGSKIEANGDGNGKLQSVMFCFLLVAKMIPTNSTQQNTIIVIELSVSRLFLT